MKPILVVGKPGTGRTTKAREFAAGPYIEMYANDVTIDDPYSFPKDVAIIIEDVHYKPQKERILDIIYAKCKVIMTSVDKKSVPKAIINACQIKLSGKVNHYQQKLRWTCSGHQDVKTVDDNIWAISQAYLRMRDRDEFLKALHIHKPAPMQILSWAAKNNDSPKMSIVASSMHRWSTDYFYALLAYSFPGKYKQLETPSRKTNNPYPTICKKLGLRETDAYLVKNMVKDKDYAAWAASKLEASECKVIGIEKPRKQQPSKAKVTKRTLEEYF